MSAINQKQVLKLQQKLSPQQIQMIKLLELPSMQLEQRVKQEIEENPVLDEELSEEKNDDDNAPKEVSVEDVLKEDDIPSYKLRTNNYSKDDKQRTPTLTDGMTLQEYLEEQVGFRTLSQRQSAIFSYLIGSIDEDGYLRRDLQSISDDIAFSIGWKSYRRVGELWRIHELELRDWRAQLAGVCCCSSNNLSPLIKRSVWRDAF